MPTKRKIVFTTGFTYHVFNRGLDKRTTFHTKRDYERAIETFRFYQNSSPSIKFSTFLNLSLEDKILYLKRAENLPQKVSIIAYCFMSNHFHFLLKQNEDGGVSKFISDFTNSFTRYYNTKHRRAGPLFQGVFKAVYIETTEQLLHVSRYIHLNPYVSSLIEVEQLHTYPWSSYKYYLSDIPNRNIDTLSVISNFKSREDYNKFVTDHMDYAYQLEKIKHLLIEEEV